MKTVRSGKSGGITLMFWLEVVEEVLQVLLAVKVVMGDEWISCDFMINVNSLLITCVKRIECDWPHALSMQISIHRGFDSREMLKVNSRQCSNHSKFTHHPSLTTTSWRSSWKLQLTLEKFWNWSNFLLLPKLLGGGGGRGPVVELEKEASSSSLLKEIYLVWWPKIDDESDQEVTFYTQYHRSFLEPFTFEV